MTLPKSPTIKPITSAKELPSCSNLKEIGRWGEEYTIKILKEENYKKYPEGKFKDKEEGFIIEKDGKTLVEVTWLNKYEDKGIGHDIKLIENDIIYYIEIKTTSTTEKTWFEMTKKEWELMQKKGDKYLIYRIFDAGTKTPKYTVIKNPAKLYQDGKIKARPIQVELYF